MTNVILDIVRLVQGPLADAAPKSDGPGGFEAQLARAVDRFAGQAERAGPASGPGSGDNGSAVEATGRPVIADSPGGASPEADPAATGQTVTPSGTNDQDAGGFAVSGFGNVGEASARSALDPALASLLDSIYGDGDGEPSLIAVPLAQFVAAAISANAAKQPIGQFLTLGDIGPNLALNPVTGEGQSGFVLSTIPAPGGAGSAADASGQPTAVFAAAINAGLASLGNGGPNELTRQPVSVPRNGLVFPLPATSQIVPVAAGQAAVGSAANTALANFTLFATGDPDLALLPQGAADAFRSAAISIVGRALPATAEGLVTPGLAALAANGATQDGSQSAAPAGVTTTGSLLSGTALNSLFNAGEVSADIAAVLTGPANAGNPAASTGAAPALLPATVVAETPGTAATPPGQATANTANTANTQGAALDSAPQFRPLAGQLAIHLAQAIQKGVSRFTIRLHPAELGRVDVRLDVAYDGRVTALISTERQEALDLLQRDSRHLERSLQDSGLKADSNSLSFSLRDHGEGHARFDSDGGLNPAPEGGHTDEVTARHENSALAAAQLAASAGPGRLNILV